jgi:putative ABC transport system substrate-binding protein
MRAQAVPARLSRRAVVGGLVGLGASTVGLRVSAAGLAMFTGCGLPSTAPKPARMPRIGALSPNSGPADPVEWTGFRDGLAQDGWIEGQSITIEWRFADGQLGRLPGLAAELVALPVELIATLSTPATVAAKQATSTVPIVFCGIGNPVGNGLVQNLARPGGNLTGTTQVGTALAGKRLSLLKELVPGLTRVVFMDNRTGAGSNQALGLPSLQLDEIQTAALELDLEIAVLDVRGEADLEPAFASARNWRAGALLVSGNNALHELDQPVIQLAARERVPALYSFNAQVEAGGLLSYGPNVRELFRRAAAYHVDRILRGAKPADLPVEQPTAFELAVNQTAAQALGLTIPPAFAAQVTEWIP